LRREVAGLPACDDPSDSFIQSPAIEIAARALAAEPLSEFQTGTQTVPLAARRLGAYQLLEPRGRGGRGEVYLALDPRLGRKVAIKLLPARFTTDSGRVRRFAQEARAASALNHPNIITIHEIGKVRTEAGDTHYIVEEFVDGETLRQRLQDAPQQRMKPSEAIDLATQIAAALAAAHEAGIAHRDIKPENVMVRRDGIVKVLDFGLAKLTEPSSPAIDTQAPTAPGGSTESGVVMGTPRYMSPEQARKLEMTESHTFLYQIAFTGGDAAGMQEQIDWARGKPEEYVAFDWQTGAAAFAGQWWRAQELSRHAIDLAAQFEMKEVAARYGTEQALRGAVFGECRQVRADALKGLALERSRASLQRAALALALCGGANQAKPMIDDLTKRYPEDTVVNSIWLPAIRAALELQCGNAAQAIEQLQTATRYEAAAEFWPQYLRGQA
jgi:hypothetical protein